MYANYVSIKLGKKTDKIYKTMIFKHREERPHRIPERRETNKVSIVIALLTARKEFPGHNVGSEDPKMSGILTKLRRQSGGFEEAWVLDYTGQSAREKSAQSESSGDMQRLPPLVFP